MTQAELFRQYFWLLNAIYESDGITLSELMYRWNHSDISYGQSLTRTTFKRHKLAIETAFGIDIECRLVDKKYKYYVLNKSILNKNSIQDWILATLSLNMQVGDNKLLNSRIFLEEIPTSGKMLKDVINAMRDNSSIIISYHRFGQETRSIYEIDPYAIKLFAQRWYIVAHSQKHDVAIYSLDRIEKLVITENKFVMPKDFDVQRHFKDCYGVIAGDGTMAEEVILRVYGLDQDYISSLPLHHSQRVIVKKDNYTEFSLYLRPTYDFKQAIMANAYNVEVVSPQHLRVEIKEMLNKAVSRY